MVCAHERFNYKNVCRFPDLGVLNMGVGDAVADAKLIDEAVMTLRNHGQKPVVTRRKAISGQTEENMPIGCKVTLRQDRMWEFFDRLVSITIPESGFSWSLPQVF